MSSSTFHYSFHLYNILKEPIPFEIHCQIYHHHHLKGISTPTNCSHVTSSIDHEQLIRNSNEKKDYHSITFRSLPIDVTRHNPRDIIEENSTPNPSRNSFHVKINDHCSYFRFIRFDYHRPSYQVLFLYFFSVHSLDFLIIITRNQTSFFFVFSKSN